MYILTLYHPDTYSFLASGINVTGIFNSHLYISSMKAAGMFVIEALSVLIQVIVFKRTRRRVFLMAPVHHHFEMAGWSETKIIVRFWLVALMFAGIGFTLFFRTLPT